MTTKAKGATTIHKHRENFLYYQNVPADGQSQMQSYCHICQHKHKVSVGPPKVGVDNQGVQATQLCAIVHVPSGKKRLGGQPPGMQQRPHAARSSSVAKDTECQSPSAAQTWSTATPVASPTLANTLRPSELLFQSKSQVQQMRAPMR